MKARKVVKRIVSDYEKKIIDAAKKDVGVITHSIYSKAALRRVPKALWEMYGLPKRNKKRSAIQEVAFLESLKRK